MGKRRSFSRRMAKSRGVPPVKDRRVMEKSMFDISRILEEKNFKSVEEANDYIEKILKKGGPPPRKARTPLEEAQDILYEAFDSTGNVRIKLARKALQISPDCADAYVLLAEEAAKDLHEACELYAKGVSAGERALGPTPFKKNVGNFWGILETRPYMRARAGLAHCLWRLGERTKAIKHIADLLRLNPGDNQGNRYSLLNLLLQEGLDRRAKKLIDQHDEYSTFWLYSRALWTFRTSGDSPKASSALRVAMEQNPFTPYYLLGISKLPKHSPEYYGNGDENEAVIYVADAIPAWLEAKGALQWLEDEFMKTQKLH